MDKASRGVRFGLLAVVLATVALAVGPPAGAVIPSSSCVGSPACTGNRGGIISIGDSSCLGVTTCDYNFGSLTVGTNSCLGALTCARNFGNVAVGDNSCQDGCSTNNGDLSVGTGSCDKGCLDSGGCGPCGGTIARVTVGDNSCNGQNACTEAHGDLTVGDNSCNGDYACNGEPAGTTIGDCQDNTIPVPACAAAGLANLLAAVTGVGPGKSLSDKVTEIRTEVAANDTKDACANLASFIGLVKAQTGKKIESTLAESFVAQAQSIETALGC
jgi:hypothetical protein